MNDPLADLLDEIEPEDHANWLGAAHPGLDASVVAKWLRANRDRVTLLLYADDRDAALRNFGVDTSLVDLDHTYEVEAWWYGTIDADGNLTGVTQGSEGDPELWEPWARERYTIPLFIRRPLEDQ